MRPMFARRPGAGRRRWRRPRAGGDRGALRSDRSGLDRPCGRGPSDDGAPLRRDAPGPRRARGAVPRRRPDRRDALAERPAGAARRRGRRRVPAVRGRVGRAARGPRRAARGTSPPRSGPRWTSSRPRSAARANRGRPAAGRPLPSGDDTPAQGRGPAAGGRARGPLAGAPRHGPGHRGPRLRLASGSASTSCTAGRIARRAGPWEAWALLAALAAATSRIELGPLVACTAFHNPAVLAKRADTIDEISGGRFILGLGAGWNETEFRAFGIPFDHRIARFEEAFTIIRGLLRDGAIDFDGDVLPGPRLRAAAARPASRAARR